jgi:hypothetical protein
MRARDFDIGRLKALGLIAHGRQKLTLRALHQLKRIRRRREQEHERKAALVRVMYGNEGMREQAFEREQAEKELELERRRLELEGLKDGIELMLAKAELAAADKAKIVKMAAKTLQRQREG